jgi:hypothetical protein
MARLARNDPRLLPGTLITLRRKCGKASCRCATGAPHESPALSVSVGGRTKILTLTDAEVPAVAAAVARYRAAVKELEGKARADLDVFLQRVQARRQAGGGRR